MENAEKQTLIEQYVQAYNAFDVDGMVAVLHPDVVFENFSGGEMTLATNGLAEFREAAEQAVAIFEAREQTIMDITHQDDTTTVAIDYVGTLAIDLPNGLSVGDELRLSGRSDFRFLDGKISYLADYS